MQNEPIHTHARETQRTYEGGIGVYAFLFLI
jgi:hypothetical protein